MNNFTQLVYVVGRVKPSNIEMLGSAFLISPDGYIVSTSHVTGADDSNLVILAPNITEMNAYQDLSDNKAAAIQVRIVEFDPIRDLVLLKAELKLGVKPPDLGSFDDNEIGEEVGIFGFPHCVEGRRTFTYQRAELGAKVLIEADGIKTKHAVINVQARPGQSGSLIFSHKNNTISGVLFGAWIPDGSSMSLGGINPRELHQTTHCVSAEYVREML